MANSCKWSRKCNFKIVEHDLYFMHIVVENPVQFNTIQFTLIIVSVFSANNISNIIYQMNYSLHY